MPVQPCENTNINTIVKHHKDLIPVTTIQKLYFQVTSSMPVHPWEKALPLWSHQSTMRLLQSACSPLRFDNCDPDGADGEDVGGGDGEGRQALSRFLPQLVRR